MSGGLPAPPRIPVERRQSGGDLAQRVQARGRRGCRCQRPASTSRRVATSRTHRTVPSQSGLAGPASMVPSAWPRSATRRTTWSPVATNGGAGFQDRSTPGRVDAHHRKAACGCPAVCGLPPPAYRAGAACCASGSPRAWILVPDGKPRSGAAANRLSCTVDDRDGDRRGRTFSAGVMEFDDRLVVAAYSTQSCIAV